MDIQAEQVRYLRAQKGWTQQHLAEACAVSLRTIQRVEKDGNAANETVSALCAVFEVDREELLVVPRAQPGELKPAQMREQNIKFLLALSIGFALGVAVILIASY